MNVFDRLSQRVKVMIVASSLFLVMVGLALLVFGTNVISHENALIEQAKQGARADMLYVHPSEE